MERRHISWKDLGSGFLPSDRPIQSRESRASSASLKTVEELHKKSFKRLKKRYFNMKPEKYEGTSFFPGVHSLYHLAKLAKKQVLNINIPPTVILGFDHDNMFIYTKPATGCLTVNSETMTPKRLTHYIKQYMDRGNDDAPVNQANRIKNSVYPKYVIRFATGQDRNRTELFYKLADVMDRALEEWGL